MISFIKGIVCEKTPATVVIETAGIGYEFIIPLSTYDALPPAGGEVKLLAHEVIREDAHLLYGFATEAERDIFRLLQNVSGIGPKTAVGALGGMTVRELRTALAERDTKRLSKISGIGKKTAERIVVELSDKINPLEAFTPEEKDSPLATIFRDAILALTQLGQPQDAVIKTVREISKSPNPPKTTEEVVKLALTR
ncbi:MAG: Holliday junction branch migration protein RuvA [Kiritimatiellaeota bacterium]|nr:Holliday junction branch migration protein RuvA [Kiritimatiellota bacterium]